MTNRENQTENDEISIATDTAENRTITNVGEEKEYVIKFLFRPKGEENNTKVAKTHYAILKVITDIYPNVQVFDNFGSTVKEFPQLKSYDEYLRHFRLQYVKSNEKKNRGSIYLAFHRIRSTVPISEIRKHSSVLMLLQKVNTRLTVHLWKEDETRIANLGFFVGVDPSNYLKEHYEEKVRSQIASVTGKSKKNIPKFQCGFTSPYHIDDDGNRTATKSYDLQVRQKDAKELINLLQQTYKENPIFIFHKMRHTAVQAYQNAIRKQNSFLSTSRVIPIQGIDEVVMFYFENDLLQLNGVNEILRHKDTATKGRWSIMTTEKYVKSITNELNMHLTAWIVFY